MKLNLVLIALCLTLTSRAVADPITHLGWETCGNENDQASVAGCTLLLAPKAKQSLRERAFALYLRGESYYHLKKFDAAIADFTAVAAIKLPKPAPNSDELESFESDAFHFRGTIHAEKGNLQQALADFNASLQIGQDPVIYEDRADVYIRLGQDDRALADLNEAIRLAPDFERCYETRGRLHQKLGQQDRANQDFAEARRLATLVKSMQSDRARATTTAPP